MGLYDATVGTILVGIFFNTFLYGLVTYQFAVYYRTRFDDRPALKYAVLFLFVLDTFHSGSAIYMAWYYVVTNFGNPAALAVGIWPYPLTPVSIAFAALVTHIYLAIRIWRLTGSKILYNTVILLAIISFILGIISGIEGWIIRYASEISRLAPLVTAWLSTQVAVDTFITTTLVIVFSRSRTGFRKTDTILNRLIRGAIQTGLFAGIFSLGDLITFVVLPGTNLFGMFGISIGRIYTNTFLDTLLTREMIRAETDGMENLTQSVMIDSVYWAPTDSQAISTVQSTNIQLKSQSTTHGVSDHAFSQDKTVSLQV